MPGSPAMPSHRLRTRIAYALVALLVGITGGLGNAMVTVNLAAFQGHLGLTPIEGAWLPAAYLMVNMSANLLLLKFRQQFGLRLYAEIGLALYAALTISYLFVQSLPMAIFVRAASGFAGATTTTLCVLYMLQAAPREHIVKTLVIGMGISQLAVPLAWILSPALLDMGDWSRLYAFEAGLALCALAAVVVLKLPPGQHVKAFEPLDFVTFALLMPALALLAAVLAQGRLQWWTEAPWLAWALVASVLLFSLSFYIEHHRATPLLQTRWLGTADTLRFAFGAIAMRFILAEQNYGAVGLMQALGMGGDQLRLLYVLILLGLIAGLLTSAFTFGPAAGNRLILASILLIAGGAFLDAHASNLTRPVNLLLSQTMLAFAGGLFLGPMLLSGVTKALANGPNYLVSFIVLFSITQSLGGLAGSAVFGTYQTARQTYHVQRLAEQLSPTEPLVAQRVQAQAQRYAGGTPDPGRRERQGTTQLAQTVVREATVLAYNDVFRLIGAFAIAVFTWTYFHSWRDRRRAAAAAASPAATADASTTTSS
ncbi:MFS transporter [Verticiella sediminum]|uniref:MFS transporter n=1 Tax=Verticiella sediminum TaxID=1247510 RepID=A0A556AWS3_9BURK|nr:MFS transporter [Verticiella sediminum]TSH97403.1 MFS transporter [Verticiella sediminum]